MSEADVTYVGAPPLLDRRRWMFVGAAALLSVLLRLRFVWTPLTMDEGGYVAIGRAWFHGRGLYTELWIDRPQALLGLFGVLAAVTGGSTAWIRIMAMGFGVLGVVGAALVARAVAPRSRWAPVLSAFLVAVFSSVATFEGFIANGELLGGSLAVLALGIGLNSARLARPWLVMFGAGMLGGLAISMRQTSIDGVLILAVAGIVTALFGTGWRSRIAALAPAVLGAGLVLGAEVAHGLATGAHDWWYCMYGYRSQHRSVAQADWPRFWRTFAVARPIYLPVLAITAIALAVAWRRGRHPGVVQRGWVVLYAWLLVMLVMFVWGGQFYRHYWVMLAFPIAVIAGTALAQLPPRIGWLLAAAAIVTPTYATLHLVFEPRSKVQSTAHEDGRLIATERIASWYRAHRQPGDQIVALCGDAALYAEIGEDPPVNHLWVAALAQADGAVDQVVDLLNSDRRPRYIVLMTPMSYCDTPDGRLKTAIDSHYRTTSGAVNVPTYQATGS